MMRCKRAWAAIIAALLVPGSVLAPLNAEAQGFGRVIGGAIGGSVIRAGTAIGSDRRFVIARPRLGIAPSRRAAAVTQLAFDRDRELLFVVLADGGARWWDLARGLERGAARGASILSAFVRNSGRASEAVTIRDDGSSALLRLDGSARQLSDGIAGFDAAARPAIAGSGATAYRTRDGNWWVAHPDGRRFPLAGAATDAVPVFSMDGSRLAWRVGQGSEMRVLRLGAAGPEAARRLSGCGGGAPITAVRFTPVGGRLLLGDAAGALCLWDLVGASAPRLLFSVRTALSGPVRNLAIDRDGRRAAVGDGRRTVELWPVAGKIERIASMTLQMRTASALALDSDRGWLLAGGEDGTVAVHDLAAADAKRPSRPVARLISTNDGWSVVDGSGRFDGSQSGIDALSWAGEAEESATAHILPVDSFSESHYEPGLLAKLDAPESAFVSANAANLPQSGYIRPANVEIDVGARDGAGSVAVTVRTESGYPVDGVAAIRLYRNGKLVFENAGAVLLETRLRLVAGENAIRAVAVGPDGVEGPPATRTVTVEGTPPSPNLHVAAIGINDYANPAWELFYPRNDAETMASVLRETGTRLRGRDDGLAFGSVSVETLLDRSARKEAIEEMLLRTSTAAHDVLVVYFAGHGYALRGKEGWDWYLLPYTREWRRRTGSSDEFDDLIRRHGLSARRLMQLLTQAAAQRVFLVLDSCYSGAVMEAVEGIAGAEPQSGDDAATQKVLRRIARVGGLHVLAASRAHERATELQLEPHGALTWLVLEGMRGRADGDGDRSVSVREVINYATAEMPNLADRLSQEPISQKPVGYSRGTDFAVAGL